MKQNSKIVRERLEKERGKLIQADLMREFIFIWKEGKIDVSREKIKDKASTYDVSEKMKNLNIK